MDDHTCETDNEPCVACAIQRGMKLEQFGISLNAITRRVPRNVVDDEPDHGYDESKDIVETREAQEAWDREQARWKKVREQNKARQLTGKHSLRMTH